MPFPPRWRYFHIGDDARRPVSTKSMIGASRFSRACNAFESDTTYSTVSPSARYPIRRFAAMRAGAGIISST
jgi:hypothetical protein